METVIVIFFAFGAVCAGAILVIELFKKYGDE